MKNKKDQCKEVKKCVDETIQDYIYKFIVTILIISVFTGVVFLVHKDGYHDGAFACYKKEIWPCN